MPVKLIGIIVLLILVTIFAGINLDNKCDISFVFHTFKDIPVFMTVIISFAIGAVLMIPFTFNRKTKNPSKDSAKTPDTSEAPSQKKEESKTLFDFKIKREAKKNAPSSDNTDKKTEEKPAEEKKSDDTPKSE